MTRDSFLRARQEGYEARCGNVPKSANYYYGKSSLDGRKDPLAGYWASGWEQADEDIARRSARDAGGPKEAA